jgi:hypothetical protein
MVRTRQGVDHRFDIICDQLPIALVLVTKHSSGFVATKIAQGIEPERAERLIALSRGVIPQVRAASSRSMIRCLGADRPEKLAILERFAEQGSVSRLGFVELHNDPPLSGVFRHVPVDQGVDSFGGAAEGLSDGFKQVRLACAVRSEQDTERLPFESGLGALE